jgi:uncharacterized protein YjiS (DUF1127 family)
MVCFCPSPLSQTYHIHLSSITHQTALRHLNDGVKQLAKTKTHKLNDIPLEQQELKKEV